MDVVAKLKGFYGNQMREPGDRFTLTAEEHFSARWMAEAGNEDEAPKRKKREAGPTPEQIAAEEAAAMEREVREPEEEEPAEEEQDEEEPAEEEQEEETKPKRRTRRRG